MPITRISSVSVYVSDVNRAIDFYVNKLGFEKRSDQPFGEGLRWVEMAPPGAQTRIVLASSFGDWMADRIGKFTGLVLSADDMEATYHDLNAKGVKFTEPPTRQDWGMMQALFEDPDGNGFVLVSRG